MKNTGFINGMKFICCLMIVIGHIYNYVGGRTIWGIRLIGGMGAKAVDVFFFFTAFLTIYSLFRKEITGYEFIKKRFFRLYPAYIVVLAAAFFTSPLRSKMQEEVLIYLTGKNIGAFDAAYHYVPQFPEFMNMLQHCLLIHGIFSKDYGTGILGPLWTMSIEWFFYMILAVAIGIGFRGDNLKKRTGQLVLHGLYILSILGGLGLYLFYDKTDMQQNPLRNIPVFLMGMLIALGYCQIISKKEMVVVSALGLAYLFLLDPSQNWLSCGMLLVALLLLTGNEKQRDKFPIRIMTGMSRLLSGKWMERGCRLSYALYLCHMLVIPFGFSIGTQIAEKLHLDKGYFLIIGTAISILGSFLCALLLNKWVEEKAGKLI